MIRGYLSRKPAKRFFRATNSKSPEDPNSAFDEVAECKSTGEEKNDSDDDSKKDSHGGIVGRVCGNASDRFRQISAGPDQAVTAFPDSAC